jgi:hypothetical protein
MSEVKKSVALEEIQSFRNFWHDFYVWFIAQVAALLQLANLIRKEYCT